jgi:hypothetical protein
VTEASDEATCDHVAFVLHRGYTALENLFKRVAGVFEGIPRGEDWHRVLLDQMAAGSDQRPAVVSERVKPHLDELRRFRHYVVHGSVTSPVDAERVVVLRRTTLDVAPALAVDLDGFDAYLATLLLGREVDER